MSCAKVEEGEGESSRYGDQVFGSRVTTSTLAGNMSRLGIMWVDGRVAKIAGREHLVQDAV